MKPIIKAVSRHPLFWIGLLFLVLPVLAFPELLFGQRTLYWTDLSWMHFPRHKFAAEEWLAGRVPLWDPYEDTGLPLLAESQVGVLYPVSVIFLGALSPSLELTLFILVHFTLAALFTFILARSLGLGRAPATVAGLAYGFGGFLMAQVPNLNIMTGAAWLPLILYAAIQATRRRTWLAALLGGIPLALQIFTAQPQVVFYSLVIICGYAAYRVGADFFFDPAHKGRPAYALHTGLLVAVVIVSGLLLAAPQLLPTLELQQISVRAAERDFGFLTKNSLPSLMFLNLVLPGLFGNNVTGFKGGDPFQEDFIYIGFLPLVLLFFCARQHTRRDMLFFVGLLLGTVLLAMGKYTPLYRYIIQYLPGFALFRIPSRWLMGVNLALAMLAAFGLETVLKRGLSRRAWLVLLGAGLLLGLGLAAAWSFPAPLRAWSSAHLNEFQARLVQAFLDKSFALDPAYRERLLPGLAIPVLLLATNLVITLGLFTLLAARRIRANTFALLAIAAIAFDLALAGGTTINPTRPAAWWWQLSGGAAYVLEHLETGRVFPLGMGSEEATVSHLGQYFPSAYRVRSAGGHGSSLRMERYRTFLKEAHPVQAVQLVGARYLLTLGQMGADAASTYPIAYSDDSSFVYENQNPLPRAFIVHRAIPADSPEESLAHFQDLGLDPHQAVVLEGTNSPPAPQPPPAGAESRAAIIREHPQLVQIEASLPTDGYLVLLDTYYPGWQAYVDGRSTPLYRANYIGRAVFVPAGEHTVRFEYRPRSFQAGLWLSLAAILAMVVAALVTPKRQARTK